MREPLLLNRSGGILYAAAKYPLPAAIRFLDAADGSPLFGTTENSTFGVDGDPEDLAVDPPSLQLFVSSGAKVVILDSLTGALANGTLALSALDAAGDGPIAVNSAADRLYVGDEDNTSPSVTYYDLSTGAFLTSNLPSTPIAAGDAPSGIAVMK